MVEILTQASGRNPGRKRLQFSAGTKFRLTSKAISCHPRHFLRFNCRHPSPGQGTMAIPHTSEQIELTFYPQLWVSPMIFAHSKEPLLKPYRLSPILWVPVERTQCAEGNDNPTLHFPACGSIYKPRINDPRVIKCGEPPRSLAVPAANIGYAGFNFP